MLAVGKAGELDAAAHVDGIDRRSRKLVQTCVAPRDDSGSDERHAAADHIHGDYVETLPLIRR